MAQARPKVIFIGMKKVGDVLEAIKSDWDFVAKVPDEATFFEGLQKGEIPSEVEAVLILDNLFDATGNRQDFEQLITYLGPYCFVGIINYFPELRNQMKERIDACIYNNSADSSLIKYYFIDKIKPAPSLNEAVSDFIRTTQLSEIASVLGGRISQENYERINEEKTKEKEPRAFFPDNNENNPYLGKIVAVTSSKGGSGKSTVTLSLASFLAASSINSVKENLEKRPLKVLILDLDVRDGQLGFFTGHSNPTIMQVINSGEVSKNSIQEAIIHDSRLHCDLLLAPKRPRYAETIEPDFYVQLLQELRKMYDYIILDTSVNYLDPLLEKVAYPAADLIVFVTDIVVSSMWSMTRWIQEVTKPKDQRGMGINKSKIGIVVNKTIKDVGMPGEKIARSALGIPVITAIPSAPKIIAHAANMQAMDVLLQHSDLFPSIQKLAKAIVGKKYNLSSNVRL